MVGGAAALLDEGEAGVVGEEAEAAVLPNQFRESYMYARVLMRFLIALVVLVACLLGSTAACDDQCKQYCKHL